MPRRRKKNIHQVPDLYIVRLDRQFSFGNKKSVGKSAEPERCKITAVSTGPALIRPEAPEERNWLPLAIAVAVVIVVAVVGFVILEHGKKGPTVTAVSAQPDPYAVSLPITDLAMSESANLAGGKMTYIDGHFANTGLKTVTAVTVQILFRNFAHEVTQNDTQSLQLIRTRVPYVDVEPVSAEPMKPGDKKEFRLAFDGVSQDWNGAFPEIRVMKIESK